MELKTDLVERTLPMLLFHRQLGFYVQLKDTFTHEFVTSVAQFFLKRVGTLFCRVTRKVKVESIFFEVSTAMSY